MINVDLSYGPLVGFFLWLINVYAYGKCINGFSLGSANIRRFMGVAFFSSAVVNILIGFTEEFRFFSSMGPEWLVSIDRFGV